MKKLLTKILIGVLAIATMLGGLVGCGSGSAWKGTTMTAWGNDVAGAVQGGFIVEKENYYYYINGYAENTLDNTFGAPVKGALMAVTKDFTQTEIVVPKLFAAKDYNAGLYIYGDYVYYGTPNTDKDSEGEIANNELTFMKSKLDGKENTKLFTLGDLEDEYRIVKNGEDVIIVYYDSVNQVMEAYNCTTKEVATIAKQDAEVEGKNGESLNAVVFADAGSAYQAFYTVTVYAEEYNEAKGEERATASYNKLYGYSVANGAVCIYDGSKDGDSEKLNKASYEMKIYDNGVLYYTETVNGVAKTYMGFGQDRKQVTNTEAVAYTTLIVSETEIYTVSEGAIIQSSLVGNYNANTKNVAINTGATALHAIKDGKIYFTDAEGGISRIELNNPDANVEKVTEAGFNASWYPIQFIGDTMFYCDSSANGANYVKYVNVKGEVKAEDTDDDKENDKFYLEGQAFLGVMAEEDVISIATAKVNDIANKLESGALVFEKDENGNLYSKAVSEAVVAVNGVKVSEETETLLDNYKKAVERANLYNKLDGIFSDKSDKAALEIAYNEVKAEIENFRNNKEEYDAINAYIGNNLLANYDQAKKLFED